jgi:hypothetical protein
MEQGASQNGSKLWFVADGYLPLKARTENTGFEGHEAMEPVLGVKLAVPPRRVKCFRMDHPAEIGGLEIRRLEQYALRFRSDVEVIVQYGRMDVAQPNLAYIGMMGHSG